MKGLGLRIMILLTGVMLFAAKPPGAMAQEMVANWADKYQVRSLVRVEHKIVDSAGVAQVFLRLDFREGLNLDNYVFSYGLTDQLDPDQASFVVLDFESAGIYQGNNWIVLRINISNNVPVLLLKIHNEVDNLSSYREIIVQSEYLFERSDLSLWSNGGTEMLFRSYASTDDTLIIKSTKYLHQLHSYLYEFEFPAADPPVSTTPSPGKSLTIDSTFSLAADQPLVFTTPGLYFIQSDSNSFAGISLLVKDRAFPGAQTIDDLIDPLIYVSTKEETQRLRNAPEQKKALDRYLMDLTRSKDRAKLFVRHYFRRVQEANQLFTHYKEGWKTDKGMVYILMGVPDQVQPVEDREVWTYYLPTGEVNFNFIRVKSIFTPHHHHLIRDKSYDRMWFGVVDQWRKGKFRF